MPLKSNCAAGLKRSRFALKDLILSIRQRTEKS